ncbi:MAG TPA: homoserine dehydrogenase [Clostridiales bacterium]|nr:homoserine dehydrogenase [Clostridiales bacterium]
MTSIAVMGHGVVGSGVVELLFKNHKSISLKANDDILVKYILDIKDFDVEYKDRFIKDFNIILNDPDIKVVVEVMGGLNPAYNYVKSCLNAGKSVVTSNKELVAAKGAELLKIAKEKNVNFLFEASVGGGIPIIRPLSQCLAANDITEIAGILNGTTNFILTKMVKDQMPFEEALKLAQKLGYAERDPSADIDGFDANRKICILASLAFGRHVYPEQVSTEGIRNISLIDFEYAASCECVIKLIARAKRLASGKVVAAVHPALVNKDSQLYSVDDVFNAILVRGDAIGDVVFYGRGAGKMPTASAVVADVIDCIKHLSSRKYLFWEDGSEDYVSDSLSDESRLFVRANTKDKATAVNSLKAHFENVYMLSRESEGKNELAFITPKASEKNLRETLNKIKEIDIQSIIHVLD